MISKAKSVAKQPVGETPKYDVHCILHHDVHLVPARHRPRLQKTEPCFI